MIALDASFLIAYFELEDPHGPRALELLNTSEDLLIHPLTWAECLVGAVRQGRADVLKEALGALGIDVWAPDADEPERLARIRVETRLRLPDCCALDVALARGADLATFDVRLAEAARAAGVTVLT